MNKKKHGKPQGNPKKKPEPKDAISTPPAIDVTPPKSAKSDAVVSSAPQNKPKRQEREKMEKIRWTDKLIALATVIIAAATIVQGCELVTGSRDTHNLAEAALTANRAWLSPLSLHLTTPLERGLPVSYQIHISNQGKEPALGVVWKANPRLVTYVPEGNGDTEPDMGANSSCEGLEPKPSKGTVIYPQAANVFNEIPLEIPDTPENRKTVASALARTGSLAIDGCFAYITNKGSHISQFRVFLRDTPNTPSMAFDKSGKVTSVWLFNQTLSGNDAN